MLVRLLALHAIERGAMLYENTRALDIAADAVLTTRGTIGCNAVIVAVDGALPRVLPELSGRVRTARLRPLR